MTEPDPQGTAGNVPKKKKAGALARLMLSLACLVLSVGLAEGVLRLMGFEYVPIEIRLIGKSDWRDYHVFQDKHFVYDRELIWKPKPGFEIFNEDGYRGPRLKVPKPEGEFRVLAVGDSNTLGWSEKDGANWPAYYGEELRKHGIRATVANAGAFGYTSYQGLVRLKQLLSLDPDLVLFSFGGNDCQHVIHSDADFAKDPIRQSQLDKLLMKTRLGQLVFKILDSRPAPKPGEGQCRVPKDQYRANLEEAIAVCKAKGADIVLLTRPHLPHPEINDPYFWSALAPDYRKIDIEVAKKTGTTLVDFKARFPDNPKENPVYTDDSHFTVLGHRLAAQVLYEETKHLLPK